MNVTRRALLQTGGGLLLGFYVPAVARGAPKPKPKEPPAEPVPPPNAFLRVGTDDSVTVLLAHSEMGQGMWTGLAMLVAEELECDWSKIRCEHAPANVALYARLGRGVQMTGGSSSIKSEFERYRSVGAAGKDMLVRAAAARWKVSAADCRVESGVITNGKKTLRFGEVAEEATKLAPPAKVTRVSRRSTTRFARAVPPSAWPRSTRPSAS